MNAIKEIRDKQQITQEYVALKIGVSVATVSRWESGEFLPRADKLKQLSEILGCTIDDLLSEQKGVVSNANDTKSLL